MPRFRDRAPLCLDFTGPQQMQGRLLDELWKVNVGAGISTPPITFEVNGKQYLAVTSGIGAAAKGRVANTPELKDQTNALVLYVFAL